MQPYELKSCPICKGEVEHESTVTEEVIRCRWCNLTMTYDGSASVLFAKWNNRAKQPKRKACVCRSEKITQIYAPIEDFVCPDCKGSRSYR